MFDVGDLVVCVDDRTSPGTPVCNVRRGKSYRVVGIMTRDSRHDLFGTSGGGVALSGVKTHNGTGFFAAARFRKIDAPDTEVSRLILACKPVRQGQPA